MAKSRTSQSSRKYSSALPKLTDAEVEKLLSGLQSESFASRDEQGAAGYADAMDMIFEDYESIKTTENDIKQLHGVLLKCSPKDQDHRGEYNKVPNDVQAFGPDGEIGVRRRRRLRRPSASGHFKSFLRPNSARRQQQHCTACDKLRVSVSRAGARNARV